MEQDVEKRRRPDRALKIKELKGLSETVVKCSLKKLLQGGKADLVQQAMEKRVWQCSQRTYNASLAINLIAKEKFDGMVNLQDALVPKLWDVTFIRQLMLGTEGAVLPDHDVTDLHTRYPNLLLQGERSPGDRNIYSAAAIKLSTNIKNHLVTNFVKLLKKYLYNTLSKDEAVYVLFKVHGWQTKKEGTLVADNVAIVLRELLGLQEDAEIGNMWFKDAKNLPAMLRLFVFVNNTLEDKNLPMFNLLPICRIKPHFITIDTSSLFGILKDVGIVKTAKIMLEDEQWDSILKTSLLKGKGKTFTKTIETDGLVVNVHFRRPKRTSIGKNPSLEGKRVIGVDPGRTNIFHMVEEIKEDNKVVFKTYKFKRFQYYVESGIFQARKRTNKWNKDIKSEIELLADASSKGSSLFKYRKFLDVVFNVRDKLWKEAFKKRWREQRFRLYGGKKRSFSKFLNRLGDPKDIVLAFGAAKFAPGGKGEVSVPTTRAFKECSNRFPIIPVDEFRTTMVHWKDLSVLKKVGKYGDDGKLVTVRGLLWCCSTIKGESKFVNRDVNASINILRCAVLPRRPSILDRKKATSSLQHKQTIGRIIPC
jgi:hypothetical protein